MGEGVPQGGHGRPFGADERSTIVIGHLAISAAGALVASVIMVEAPGGLVPFVAFLLAVWVAVSELVNAADVQFDFAWADDDGTPRPPPWSQARAASIGLRLRRVLEQIRQPVDRPLAVAGSIEVIEVLPGSDDQ